MQRRRRRESYGRPVKNASSLETTLFKIPYISTRQTKRTRARTHKPRPPIGCSCRVLSGVAKKTKKQLKFKKSLCRRSSRNHGILRNLALRYTLRAARTRPQRAGRRIARRRCLFNCFRAGCGYLCKLGNLWPPRMAKHCESPGDERRRKAEHGGVGAPYPRGASGMVVRSGAGEVGSVSGARALGGSSAW